MEQNFNLIYKTSFENDSFLELQRYCTDLITKKPAKIFSSLGFSSISENLLISIIRNDNLQMSEIQVWEHVLKWGLAQNPELASDITNYSKDDFNALKSTLRQIIPFIKFYNLTSKEFTDKVLPYKRVLPKELYKDLLKSFLNLLEPNSMLNNNPSPHITKEIKLKSVSSKIITSQHAELISKWINRLEITDELNSPYEYKLLFRGSRDGFTTDRFHRICDDIRRTVTIVKVIGSNEILGGYNPIGWTSECKWSITKDSFVFSFNNGRIEDYILSRVMNQNYAISNGCYYGPSFGDGDLTIVEFDGDCNSYSKKGSYEKSIRKTGKYFAVEECEVFQII
ncbi:carbohydrate-binding module family 13 protein [Rhizophagus clarus]|nr:carbohydrate-binding module family 13 protein [Rhizophagus clarus]